jgi:anthranilate phosphoribosyltransferase
MTQLHKQFEKLFNNKMDPFEAKAFLVSLYERGETAEEIAVAASVMRKHSVKLPISHELQDKAIDIVGTGGDMSGSFNISTTVSLLLASLGSVVAKHGNRGITSRSGSADLLEALGMNLHLAPGQQVKMLEETGFCFIFAMNHHPAMKHIMPIRKSIGHRTIFNLLGPLTNPAGAHKYLLGVFDPSYIQVMAEALLKLDVKRAHVVSSSDGMDEISISAVTPFAYVEAGHISHGIIDPEVFGFKLSPKEAVLGGSAEENANITKAILSGEERGAKRDIVLINAMFALFTDGNARDLQEAKEIISSALDNGKAIKHLDHIVSVSQSLANRE